MWLPLLISISQQVSGYGSISFPESMPKFGVAVAKTDTQLSI